ncbi:hypothetical protein [Sulfuriferula plumbiphila]|uniref:hypothetical protein n=1 Tax=Sulfuriferula plumbiphila TaxID=171865 RepID=UPI0011BDB5EF|nr:hypothetical protein [Sulfuriferula plumbiphila]
MQPVEQVIAQASMAALRPGQIHHSAKHAHGKHRHVKTFSDDPAFMAQFPVEQAFACCSSAILANSPDCACTSGTSQHALYYEQQKAMPPPHPSPTGLGMLDFIASSLLTISSA